MSRGEARWLGQTASYPLPLPSPEPRPNACESWKGARKRAEARALSPRSKILDPPHGSVADHALVSPDSKPSSNGSGLPVMNENTIEAVPGPQAFSDRTRQ